MLVERKSKQTALDNKPELMSSPIYNPAYSIPYGTRHSPLCSETLNSRWNAPPVFFKRKFPIKLGQAEENLFPLLAPSLILASPMTPGSPKEKAAWKNYCWCVILSDGLCTTSSDWKSPKSSRLKDQSATASEQKLPTFVCMVPLTNSLHIAVNHKFYYSYLR